MRKNGRADRKRSRTPLRLLALAGMTLASLPALSAPPSAVGYITEVPPETPAARRARHEAVARRRAGTAVIVHRGAAAFAPENTLEAYAAAIDYGADGCEVDIRLTRDGVLVLFHDDMLDRLTDGLGTVRGHTYPELLGIEPRLRYGTATRHTRLPTFAALLALARQRAMLLHLDVKEPGLDDRIAALLQAADAWDHVVAVNAATAPKLGRDPRVRPLAYKGPGLYAGRRDVDPKAVRSQLGLPGQMIMVDDPRVAARELDRAPYRPVPLPKGLRARPVPGPPLPPGELDPLADRLRPPVYPRIPEVPDLPSFLLSPTDPWDRAPGSTVEEERQFRARRIVERAWAAQEIGRGRKTRTATALLRSWVRRRSLHEHWIVHGLDGAMAARALGMLKDTEAAPAVIEAFRRIDPELKRVADPRFGQHPLAWTDYRFKMHLIPALGDLRCDESRQFLREYVALPEEEARKLSPPMYEEATRALFQQELTRADIEALLRSENPAVRGTAVLECLDHPDRDRTAALKEAAPWTDGLPSAD